MRNQDDRGAMFWQSRRRKEQLVGALQRARCELKLARTLMRPTSEGVGKTPTWSGDYEYLKTSLHDFGAALSR
jgi:hypothetical protein